MKNSKSYIVCALIKALITGISVVFITGIMLLQPKLSWAQKINASDYSSIQMAINELPKRGGVVYVPSGTYRISKPIVITQSNVTLKGAGGSTVLLNTSKEGENTIELRGKNKIDGAIWHLKIQDMHFKGTKDSGNAIYGHWVDELSISDLWIDYHGKSGIVLDHCIENPRIHDNNIDYNKEAGIKVFGSHDIVISANELEGNGTGVFAYDSYNATVTGNNIDDHTEYAVYFDNTPGSLLTGNMLEESGEKCVVIHESNGVALTGNTLRTAGRQLLHIIGSTLISVNGNTFDRSKGNAIEVEKGSKNIIVSGNTFGIGRKRSGREIHGIVMRGVSNTTIASNTIIHPSKGGIYILGKTNRSVTIEGNTIINPSYNASQPFSGIYFQNTINSIISGNIIRDKGSGKVMKWAIEEGENSDYNIISHNQVNKGIQGAIKIIGADTKEDGNKIK